MAESLGTGVLAAYYGVLGLLALYALHRLLLVLFLRRRSGRVPAAPAVWPRVTVQLPVYNEVWMAPRLLRAVAAFDYPRDRLEIQVLDDSTDETSARLAAVVAELRAVGCDVVHLRRELRFGYKAGALAAGLAHSHGELVAIFDADFLPEPDFLRRAVPHFADPGVGMVQAAWGHLNRERSLLTAVQALLLDGHFQVEHAARHQSGLFFNFNGTAGLFRRRTIEDAGGWQHDTLTEDLDLSYRAQLRGWRFVFLPDLVVPSQLPADIAAWKGQQNRWTRGSAQTLRKLGWRVLRARLPWRIKLESMVHLTNNLCYPLMVALGALLFPAMYLRHQRGDWRFVAIDAGLFAAATLSLVVFYLGSQAALGRSRWRALALQLPLMALGIGMSWHNARATLTGLFRRGGVFVRTPKNPHRVDDDDLAHYQPLRQPVLGELLYCGYLVGCTVLAVVLGVWWALPFLALFVAGSMTVTGLTLAPRFGWRQLAQRP